MFFRRGAGRPTVAGQQTTAAWLAPRHPSHCGGPWWFAWVIRPQDVEARRLQEAIKIYRAERTGNLSNRAKELLSRLSDNPDAIRALVRLLPKSKNKTDEILSICIEADELARTFPQWIAQAARELARADRADKAVAILRQYIDEADAKPVPFPSDLLSYAVYESPADLPQVQEALDLIARRIGWLRGVAELAIAQIGATRKSRNKKAAEIAAIWFLAARVHGAVGRRHFSEVADLAEAIWGVGLTEDQLDHLLDKRRQLYAKVIGNQTRRHLADKAADARRPRNPR